MVASGEDEGAAEEEALERRANGDAYPVIQVPIQILFNLRAAIQAIPIVLHVLTLAAVEARSMRAREKRTVRAIRKR